MKMMKKGFTLIEVLVAIVIIAILAAVAVPSYNDYIVSSKDSAAKISAEAFQSMANVEASVKGSVDFTDLKITVPETIKAVVEADKAELNYIDGGTKKYTVSVNTDGFSYKVVESDL